MFLVLLVAASAVNAQDLNSTDDGICEGIQEEIAIDDSSLDAVGKEDVAGNSSNQGVEEIPALKNASFEEVTTTYYLPNSTFYVKLLGDNDTPLANKKVKFTVNGESSTVKTTSYGNAKLLLDLTKGKYTIKYSFNEDGYTSCDGSAKIIIVNTKTPIIKGTDYVAYVGFKNAFTVTLTIDGMPMAGREVVFTVNGKSYFEKTDSKGKASLPIGLKKGVYSMKYSYAGEAHVKKASGKSKLTSVKGMPKKITKANSAIYRHKTPGKFKIKLSDARGNLLKNKKITFTIKGKKYVKYTNSKGIATLDIKLKKGTYKLKVYSGKTSLYKKASKTYTIKVKPTKTRQNGVWLFGADMKKVNLNTLKKYGTKHIFLNFKSLELWGQKDVEKFVADANAKGIKVHLWMQVFHQGGKWYNPVKNKKINYDLINSKIKLAKKYAKVKGIAGVHFDYLRYPGTAYKYANGVKAINYFTKHASAAVHKINPNLIVSAAVMPEPSSMKYYYGQDIPTMTKYLDVIVPMEYKGNYNAGSAWITKVTKSFVKKSSGAKVWVGLQSYNSDSKLTKRSASSLMNDAFAASMGGASGVMMFRFGLLNYINFNDV